MTKIDSHQHFWRYNVAEYPWLGDTMSVLHRDFLPEHLTPEMSKANIGGVVSVEARAQTEETRWLLELARTNQFIRGVVGWVPLASPSVAGELEEFSSESNLKGVRYALQGEPDDMFMLREDFNAGVSLLQSFNLTYDLLIVEKLLPQTIAFVDRHPQQPFILDHIAKPRITGGVIEPWRTNLRELARRDNVCCKISGLVTEADFAGWTEAQLAPYFETVLETFGAKRLMFGSDWPVCTVACEYERWHAIVDRWVGRLSVPEQEEVLGGTAVRAYNLTEE